MAELMQNVPQGGSANPLSADYLQRANTLYQNSQQQPYTQALNQARQRYASAGLQDSGLGAQAQLGLSQQRNQNANAFAGQQIQNQGQLQYQSQEAQKQRDFEAQQAQQAFQRQADLQGQQQTGNLISEMAGAGGAILGGPIGMYAGSKLAGMFYGKNNQNGVGGVDNSMNPPPPDNYGNGV
jgi:hypothetical protein